MGEAREGGCLCGAVRYRIAWPPLAVATCSCRNCQKQSGSALSLVLVLARDALTLTGTLGTYVDKGTSGQDVLRRFCPACGSPVLTDTPRAEAGGMIFVKGGTLDDTSGVSPTDHYWHASAQPWMRYPEAGARHARE